MAQPATQMTPAQVNQFNLAARAAIVTNAVKMIQPLPVASVDFTKGNPSVVISPKNVGLLLGFIVNVFGTLTNGAGSTANRTELGGMNLVDSFLFQDLNSNTRINTTGWHIGLLNCARQGFAFGGAYSPNVGANFGNNWSVQTCPTSITASTDAAVSQYYYVPISYSATDLRGAIYCAVTNGTQTLQINLNLSPFSASGDATAEVFSGNAGTWKTGTNINVNVWQVYYDQLPTMKDPNTGQVSPILPPLDMNAIYTLKQTSITGMTANQDFPYSFTNFQDFLSAIAILDNNGTLGIGADVNYWSLQSANATNILKYTANTAALLARQTFMSDPPKGVYYFDFRDRPINTNQFGNMQLIVNPTSSINVAANLLVAVESFSYPNTLAAQSLPGG